MALQLPLPASAPNATESGDEEAHREKYEQLRQLVSTYPTAPSGLGGGPFHRHPDGWYMFPSAMVGAMVAQRHFLARSTDVLLATFPKCGTTWLKALLFATVRRGTDVQAALAQLRTQNPHELVPSLEIQLYVRDRIPDLISSLPAPRLLGTHIPSQSLPESVVVRTSGACKVVYVCRNPKDCFVSLWHFWNTIRPEPLDMDEGAVRLFCDGVSPDGPYWEHVLGYWRWHVEAPGKVLFMTYEEVSRDTLGQLRRLADFVDRPFTAEERAAGVDEAIVKACSLESLAGSEVNRSGKMELMEKPMRNNMFFRRGVVGDWHNYLTPAMAKMIDEITETKFRGSGLVLHSQ